MKNVDVKLDVKVSSSNTSSSKQVKVEEDLLRLTPPSTLRWGLERCWMLVDWRPLLEGHDFQFLPQRCKLQ